MHLARRDFIVGVFVVIGLGAIAYLSLEVGGMSYTGPGGFRLVATFDEIGGLTSRAPVVISGVKVGQVTDIELDGDLRARVLLDVRDDLELSIDTSAAIRTSGLLGNQFIALEPGGEIDLLTSGESLDFTENALNLEKLIGAFVHGSADGD
ncbi:MAG: outer membrane lipid asymmetry maintenance protein MlaD [bacterium]|nr:outer membrane lipid asymmetry maintenance protein MlaD [bacterium]